jgi:hypothetical protein
MNNMGRSVRRSSQLKQQVETWCRRNTVAPSTSAQFVDSFVFTSLNTALVVLEGVYILGVSAQGGTIESTKMVMLGVNT